MPSSPVPITVSSVIAHACRLQPDVGNPAVNAANTYALTLFQTAHNEIMSISQLPSDTTHQITWIANTASYAIPAYIKKIWDVEVFTEAGSAPYRLNQRDKDWLDVYRATWRGQPGASTPTDCALDGANLLVYPMPSQSSVGGYPYAQLWTLDGVVLATGDALPSQVQDDLPWVYLMLYRHAVGRRKDLIKLYKELSDEQRERLLHDDNARMERDKPAVRRWQPRLMYP